MRPQRKQSPIDRLLDRLTGVRKTRTDRWQALCPAHDDRSPSLSITECSDGTVLIRCWAGCTADAIAESVGLELRDLFPDRLDYQSHQPGNPPRYSAAEVVRLLLMEATIVGLGYRTLQKGETLNSSDQARVEVAMGAIDNCREVVCR